MNLAAGSPRSGSFAVGLIGAIVGGMLAVGVNVVMERHRLLPNFSKDATSGSSVEPTANFDARIDRIESVVASLLVDRQGGPEGSRRSPASSGVARDGSSDDLRSTVEDVRRELSELSGRFASLSARPSSPASVAPSSTDVGRRLDGIETSLHDAQRELAKHGDVIRDSHLSGVTSLQDMITRLDAVVRDIASLDRRVEKLEATR